MAAVLSLPKDRHILFDLPGKEWWVAHDIPTGTSKNASEVEVWCKFKQIVETRHLGL
jgi:hypothetical protein